MGISRPAAAQLADRLQGAITEQGSRQVMTPDQERAVAEALAEGLSERETAKRTGVSPTSVHQGP